MTHLSVALLATASLAMLGCASQASTRPDPRDPYERFNRAVFTFNDKVDRAIAKPVARTYRKVTPDLVETGVSNFVDNLGYSTVLVNNLLQGKLKHAMSDTGRLVLNTTLGLGGVLDPASDAGLAKNDEDFGQTLGRWGVPAGPYLMLPFLGPSTIRDGLGEGVDTFTDAKHYLEDNRLRWGLRVLDILDSRARLLSAEGTLDQAYDRYTLLRSAYLQRREYQVQDGDVAGSIEDELLRDLEMEDESSQQDESGSDQSR